MKSPHAMPADYADDTVDAIPVSHRPIGSLIREACGLSEAQIRQIAGFQRETGMRFGEAAVALRFAERKDVVEALSRQFQYTTGFAGREADSELVTAADPFSDQADAFRELRSRLLLEVLGERPRCALAVVSPDVGDGKTYLAANLAVAFSQLGERTLLIDADIRTPRQHRLLGVEHSAGLSSVLAGFVEPGRAVQPVSGLPGLYLLPAGGVPPNPLELLQRPAFGVLVREMVQKFEHVVLDTPAAIRGADARVVAARCGAAIAVARRGRSRMDALEGLLAALARGPARIAGVVMNEH
jgi:chain length determinant protein tyrosine kinase EpsG